MKKIFSLILVLLILVSCASKKEINNESSSIIYEIFPSSFYDSNDDGIGDLNGISLKLDYLKSLGVKNIWLTPISEAYSYHKYDVINYLDVDKSLGSIEDFDNLVKKAQEANIGIIYDLVINHTSNMHPWFIEAKKAILNGECDKTNKCDYYNFSDTKNAGYGPLGNNIYYEARFYSGMPDLNLESEDVRKEIETIIKFWIDHGVSGFRLDAPLHYYAGNISKNNEFLSWLNQTIKKYKKDAFIVGEVWSDESTILSHYESGIESFFNFKASQSDGKIISSIRSQNGLNLATYQKEYHDKIKNINKEAHESTFLSNHDTGRSGGYFSNDLSSMKLMMATLLLSPGYVYLYYGEEIGMLGSGKDENKRLAMPWGENNDCMSPSGADYKMDFNSSIQEQLKDPNSLLSYIKKINALRCQSDVYLNGELEVLNYDDNIYSMRFYNENDNLIVIHNFSSEVKEIKLDVKVDKIELLDDSKYQNGTLSLNGLASAVVYIEGE